jgi:hypothetical protein
MWIRNRSDPELHRIVDQGPDPAPDLDPTFEIRYVITEEN